VTTATLDVIEWRLDTSGVFPRYDGVLDYEIRFAVHSPSVSSEHPSWILNCYLGRLGRYHAVADSNDQYGTESIRFPSAQAAMDAAKRVWEAAQVLTALVVPSSIHLSTGDQVMVEVSPGGDGDRHFTRKVVEGRIVGHLSVGSPKRITVAVDQ
jgi:hypothetical protein